MEAEKVLKLLEKCETQLTSASGAIRAQTATIISSLVKSFPHREKLQPIAHRFIAIFIKLLKDESVDSRARAAEALSHLHTF